MVTLATAFVLKPKGFDQLKIGQLLQVNQYFRYVNNIFKLL